MNVILSNSINNKSDTNDKNNDNRTKSNNKNKTSRKALLYEGIWNLSRNKIVLDDVGIPFKYPKHSSKEWKSKLLFLKKLKRIEKSLDKYKKYTKYKHQKDCILCGEKNITTKLYRLINVNWEDGLKHYIDDHNIIPDSDFMDHIYSHYMGVMKNNEDNKSTLIRLPSIKYSNKKNKINYIKIDKNQILIMDALYQHGSGKKKYENEKDSTFHYSEHAGLLQFDNGKLDKISIYGTTNRIDPSDSDIFLPKNTEDAYDYAYIFHTHPATPYLGSRTENGILYEFPSTSDIFHFVEHYTIGNTKGSIIIAPEGLYLIRKKKFNNKPFNKLDNFYSNKKSIHKHILQIQEEAISKYPPNKTNNSLPYEEEYFYDTIAQDRTFINKLNKVLEKYDLIIEYSPRIKDKNNNWTIDTILIKVIE